MVLIKYHHLRKRKVVQAQIRVISNRSLEVNLYKKLAEETQNLYGVIVILVIEGFQVKYIKVCLECLK